MRDQESGIRNQGSGIKEMTAARGVVKLDGQTPVDDGSGDIA